jgi:hypothetical protein
MYGDDGTRAMKRRRTAENRRAFCVRKQKQDLRMFLNCAFAYKLDKMRKSFCLSNSAIMAALSYRKLALFLTLKLCYNDLIIRHRRMFKPDNSFPLNIPENHPKTPEIACRH